jgi:hypothetical protein
LRRTTSALTTAVLGAVLTASIFAAQQSAAPDNSPQARPAAAVPPAAPDTANAAASSQLYGMSATRGARFLLRNGLDYLNYQEYDRALKFLREAESRQKELNDAEKTALKQGIESAQRGLRNATDAEAPYALSDRSRPRNGFAPAKPETRVAATNDRMNPPSRQAETSPPSQNNLVENEGDERGEPIRLASSEAPIGDQAPETNSSPRSTNSEDPGATASSGADQPRSMPEIPRIPTVAQLPDLTKADGSERPVAVPKRNTPGKKPARIPVASVAGRVAAPVVVAPVQEQAAPVSYEVSKPAESVPAEQVSKPVEIVPAEQVSEPAEIVPADQVSKPAEIAPADQVSKPAEIAPADLQPVADPGSMPAAPPLAPAGEKMPTPEPDLVSPAPANDPPIDPKMIPASAPVEASPPPIDLGSAVHQETEPAAPTSIPAQAPAARSVQNVATVQPTVTDKPVLAAPGGSEEFPALPADLSQPAPAVPVVDRSTTQPATTAVPGPVAPSDDELPTLPADLGRSVPAAPAPTPAPSQGGGTPPVHTEQESLIPLASGGGEAQPAPTVSGGESPPINAGTAPTIPPASTGSSATAESQPTVAQEPTTTELPVLPSEATPASPAGPVRQLYPSTNPNLQPQPQPATTPVAASENGQDGGSLPPAIADAPLATGSDLFIPDRPVAPSTLRPDLMREVEKIARNQEDELRRKVQNPPQPAAPAQPRDTMASDLRTQTQLDISRAPSPAEARPIKAIPVPEDWVPLPPRNWTPQRKYWAAAATCHLPLYFQDPVLERYGHSVEQFVGPIGRFLTYPIDDPTQSTQRVQMAQPFVSAGLMGLQIIAWPYNLIMDPPWETQYDLGYYRPGDNIPTDLYWLPLHGYGPPLRGSNY